MSKVLQVSMAVTFVLFPAIAALAIGYGIGVAIIGPLVFGFIGVTLALTVYSLYVLSRYIFSLFSKTDRTSVSRLAFLAVILASVIVVSYSAPRMVRYGAAVRVNSLGGEDYVGSLIEDAADLLAVTRGSRVTRLHTPELPSSILALGGDSALIFHEDVSYIELVSSGRPIRTGWIIVPNKDDLSPRNGALRVSDHIYRYY